MELQEEKQEPEVQTQTTPNPVFTTSPGFAPQQPQHVYATIQRPVNPSIVETYDSRYSKAFGITLIVSGGLAVVFNIIGLIANDGMAVVAHGFWCGFFFILTGAIGCAASSKNRCMIKAFLALAIISALLTIAMFGIAVAGLKYNSDCNEWNYWCPNKGLSIACEAILTIVAIVAGIVSIWASVVCCQAVGCCATPSTGVVATPYGNQQMFVIQQQGTNQYVNPQMITMSVSSSGNQVQGVSNGYPGPYSPTQPQYVAGQYPPQYSVASETTIPADTPATTSPPGYAA